MRLLYPVAVVVLARSIMPQAPEGDRQVKTKQSQTKLQRVKTTIRVEAKTL